MMEPQPADVGLKAMKRASFLRRYWGSGSLWENDREPAAPGLDNRCGEDPEVRAQALKS
jgi:hypothetical protein